MKTLDDNMKLALCACRGRSDQDRMRSLLFLFVAKGGLERKDICREMGGYGYKLGAKTKMDTLFRRKNGKDYAVHLKSEGWKITKPGKKEVKKFLKQEGITLKRRKTFTLLKNFIGLLRVFEFAAYAARSLLL